MRGRLVEEGGWAFFCTYHPAAVIYNPDLEKALLGDLRRLKEIIDKTGEETA